MGAVGAAVAGAAVSTVGGKLMSGGKGSGGSTSQASSTGPWEPQQPYIQGALSDAQSVYNQRKAQGPYTGDFTAGQNGIQTGAINQAAGWANGGAGSTLPGMTAGSASTLQGASSPFVQNAYQIAQNGIAGPNQGLSNTLQGFGTGQMRTQGPNSDLSHALNQSAVQGAQSLGQFQNTLQNASQQGLSDPTQRLAADASAYANNPGVQASMASVNSQIDQTLHEQTLPGLNRQAAMGGMLNSSRAGMAESMANEGAGIAKGNADSQILNNAYNSGLGVAANTYNSGLNSAINGASLGYNGSANNANTNAARQTGLNEFNTTTQLGAANSGLANNLNYSLGNANTQLGANQQLGSAAGMGVNAATAAGQQANNNFGLGSAAGGLQQTNDTASHQNDYLKWQMQNQYQQNVLNDYWNIASNKLGSSGTKDESTTLPENTMGNMIGGGLAGYGLYKQANGSGQSGSGSNFLGIGNGNSNSIGLLGGQGPIFNSSYGQYNGGQSLYGAYNQ